VTEAEVKQSRRTPEEIQTWLIERFALYTEQPAEQVDPEAPLVDAGLDSVFAFALCGEIEDVLGLSVEPVLLWEVETLAELATHLVGLTEK
jgi:acyl carrier protein